jgi:hypothetical protein
MPGNLRDVSHSRRHRDPSGKGALFSHEVPLIAAVPDAPAPIDTERDVTPRRAASVVVECSACDTKTRVSYFDFVLMNLPVGVWLPLPGLQFNHRMTCPSCGQWTWQQVHWFA